MNKVIKILLALFFIYCIVMGIYTAGVYNSFITANENIENQFAVIESKLQRRYDLIPNLVNVVKGYMKHEEEVFTAVAEAGAAVKQAYTISDKIAANNMMDLALSRLIVLMNNYPELKSNQNVTALIDELAGTENRISIERDRYNQLVMEYNKTVKSFPKNIIASAFNFDEKPYFKADVNAQTAPKDTCFQRLKFKYFCCKGDNTLLFYQSGHGSLNSKI